MSQTYNKKVKVLTRSFVRTATSGGVGGKDKWNPLDDGSLDYM